jgi:hypothetical protein
MKKDITHTIPILTKYFHAVSLTETKDIFNSSAGSVIIKPDADTAPYDVIIRFIKPQTNGLIKPDERSF